MQIQDLEQYRQLAARTLNTEEAPYNTMLHLHSGIKGELGELTDIFKKHYIYGKELDMVHVSEEFGDIMWYVINQFTLLNRKVSLKHNNTGFQYVLENMRGTSAENILLYLVYNQPNFGEGDYSVMVNSLSYALALGVYLEETYDSFNLFESLSNNIIKLQQRYPDKYTDQDALERKDKNEST